MIKKIRKCIQCKKELHPSASNQRKFCKRCENLNHKKYLRLYNMKKKVITRVKKMENKEMKPETMNEFVILTWNGAEDTKKLVCSIIATVNKCQFVFVDNGSTDDTIHFLESIPRAKILKVKCGFAEAVNKGLSECVTKYPTVCNNDIIVVDNWHTNLMTGMRAYPNIKVLVPTTDCCGEPMQWFPSPECVKPSVIATKEINMVCFTIDREYWMNHKLDESYISGVEDVDYCWQVKKDGFNVGVCLASFVHHEGSKTNQREYNTNKMKSNLVTGWKLFAKKWGNAGALRANEYFNCKNTDELKKAIESE